MKKNFLILKKKPIEKMRKMLVAKQNLDKGQVISLRNISFKSPGVGLEPHEFSKILNKKLTKKILKDEKFSLKHFK